MEFWLAPMERVTDCAFRTLAHRYGADMTVTPFIKLYSFLRHMDKATLRFDLLDDTPTEVQLMTNNLKETQKFVDWFKNNKTLTLPTPENLLSHSDMKFSTEVKTVARVVKLSRVKGFDLNVGCPDPYVVETGRGAALIKRTKRVCDLVSLLKTTGLPVSIKMRLGANALQKKHKTYLRLVTSCDADAFIVHARHGKESYNDPADASVFPELVDTGKHIIANCDVKTVEDVKRFRKTGVAGVMIGRPAVIKPQIFAHLKGKSVDLSYEKVKKEYTVLARKFDIPKQDFLFTLNHIGKKFKHNV